MKREKIKNRLIAGLCLGLAVCLGLSFLVFSRAAVGCFSDVLRMQELYPWLISEAEPGAEGAMYTLEDKQAEMALYGVLGLILALSTLVVGTFLARQGWKRWRAWKT